MLLLKNKPSTTKWAYTDSNTVTYSITKPIKTGRYFAARGDELCLQLFLEVTMPCSPTVRDCVFQAFCGFKNSMMEKNKAAVCTGNWGCGAFGGDKQLKCELTFLLAQLSCL